jgi:pyruvate/2-oxoglutarate dehydrogenase complex dihydrolipoamide acyltransferase (E2) component
MPKLGLTMVEGKVIKWIKHEGETVREAEPLFEIETEKVEMEIEAQASGILEKIIVQEGATVPVGEPVAIIEQPEVIPSAETPPETKISPPRPQPGTGPTVIEAGPVPLSDVRKTIAERMLTSLQQSAQLTIMAEADVTELRQFHQMARAEIETTTSLDLTYTDLLVIAVAKALKEHPILNSAFRGDKIEVFEKVHMGIAVATDRGLIVPVLRDADGKSLAEVARSRRGLVDMAREGKLSIEDVEGGTFTITNLGMFGVGFFTPITNPPQSSILGIGAIVEKPSVVNGQISARWMMPLSFTFDHRVADGSQAGQFLMRVKEILENPHTMLAAPSSTSKP